MNFSQYAGIAIVPTLSRLVLAAAFLFTGYGKLFKTAEFDGKQAEQLKNLGVNPSPKVEKSTPTAMVQDFRIIAVSFRQDAVATQPGSAPPAAEEAPSKPATATPPVSATTAPASSYTARSLHYVTIMLDNLHWPYPVWQAWAVALTEFLGGAFMLIGLFSRFWGLGLATVMGFAFYLTSLPGLQNTHVLDMDPQLFTSAILQLGLFVLAFGVMLTGAGPLSLDRFLFARSEPAVVEDNKRH